MAGLAHRGRKDKGVKVQDMSHATLPPVPFRGVQSELHHDPSSKHYDDIRKRHIVSYHAMCHIRKHLYVAYQSNLFPMFGKTIRLQKHY